MTYQNQAQPGQYPKNPNGGYLKKSSYGQDSWYGTVTITPELLAQIQQTGKVLIEVKDAQTNQYGVARRTVAKPYTPKQQPQQFNQAAPAPQPQHSSQGFAGGVPSAPTHPVNAPSPAGANFINDDINF